MASRKRKVTVPEEPLIVEEPVVAEPLTVAAPDLKSQLRKLIEEAPLLSQVQGNAWLYTEWLARVNALSLQ